MDGKRLQTGHVVRIATLLLSLAGNACHDSTAPLNVGTAHYTVTLLPANTSAVFDDNAYFLLYRAGPTTPSFDLAINFSRHLTFDQCGLTAMAAVPGQFDVNGTGITCGGSTPSPILLADNALVSGVVDQSTSTMTLTQNGTGRLEATFVINFRSSSGAPSGRIEGSFSATPSPCQSKVGSDGQLTAPCPLPQ